VEKTFVYLRENTRGHNLAECALRPQTYSLLLGNHLEIIISYWTKIGIFAVPLDDDERQNVLKVL